MCTLAANKTSESLSADVASRLSPEDASGSSPETDLCLGVQWQCLRNSWKEARGVVLGLAALVAACSGAQSNDPDSSGAYTCPEPRTRSDVECQPNKVWARDVRTHMCCAYADPCVAPAGSPVFESEQECETSCRCAMLTGDPANLVEHTSLDCACHDADCVESLTTAASALCARGGSVLAKKGCGMVQLPSSGVVTSSSSSVYDQSSGALLGLSMFSDTASPPCQTFNWVAGQSFDCDNVQTCQLCGESSEPGIPSCN